MAYYYDNLKLDKGMYREAGRSFSQVLEREDPSERYKGTSLEGLDAFQRQLKRFDIKVKGEASDPVEAFFRTSDAAVLFPEYISRTVRQGMEEGDVLPHITAAVTRIDGMDYRSISSEAVGEEKKLRPVPEGTMIPSTSIKVQANLVKLKKRGRMLVASYEAVRFQKLDLFSVTLRQIGAHIARTHLEDAVDVLINGDGNENPAATTTIEAGKPLDYGALVDFWAKFDPYVMNTLLVSGDGFLETMLGMQLGWLNVFVSRIVIYGLLLLLLLSIVRTEDSGNSSRAEISGLHKASFLVVCGLSVAMVFASMFMSWTPRGSISIMGIQGRYFLPLLPLLWMTCYSPNITLKKDVSRKLMYFAVSLQCVAVYGILTSLERIL